MLNCSWNWSERYRRTTHRIWRTGERALDWFDGGACARCENLSRPRRFSHPVLLPFFFRRVLFIWLETNYKIYSARSMKASKKRMAELAVEKHVHRRHPQAVQRKCKFSQFHQGVSSFPRWWSTKHHARILQRRISQTFLFHFVRKRYIIYMVRNEWMKK